MKLSKDNSPLALSDCPRGHIRNPEHCPEGPHPCGCYGYCPYRRQVWEEPCAWRMLHVPGLALLVWETSLYLEFKRKKWKVTICPVY